MGVTLNTQKGEVTSVTVSVGPVAGAKVGEKIGNANASTGMERVADFLVNQYNKASVVPEFNEYAGLSD